MISRYVYCTCKLNTKPHGKCFVRYLRTFKHEFVFASLWYVNSSCLNNTVRAYFPCTILNDWKFLLVTCNLVWSLVRASTLFQEKIPFFFCRLPALYSSVESQSNFNLQVSLACLILRWIGYCYRAFQHSGPASDTPLETTKWREKNTIM